mmetsp:Transcript_4247/g.5835  ORF Transcript_4247/g.5835 Transcript_4247/m.5835 type:complete len:203 (-) Transcript_4247:1967-2575(-)
MPPGSLGTSTRPMRARCARTSKMLSLSCRCSESSSTRPCARPCLPCSPARVNSRAGEGLGLGLGWEGAGGGVSSRDSRSTIGAGALTGGSRSGTGSGLGGEATVPSGTRVCRYASREASFSPWSMVHTDRSVTACSARLPAARSCSTCWLWCRAYTGMGFSTLSSTAALTLTVTVEESGRCVAASTRYSQARCCSSNSDEVA